MSLNSEETKGGSSSAGGAALGQAPRLLPGGYAAWRPRMDVFLQRAGAESIHTKAATAEAWKRMSEHVDELADAALADAMALVLGTGDGASSSTSVSEEVKAARKTVAAMVERSRRVYGILYASLPEELCAQVAHLPAGWAHGLWNWLEHKFQSTERDSVGALLAQWSQLRQSEDESFDAYRARVDKLATLLSLAKEKQSGNMYVHVLLDRLTPFYTQAVLALKAGGQLSDPDKVAWDTVTSFLNNHERAALRLGESAEEHTAMAARGSYAAAAGGRAGRGPGAWSGRGAGFGAGAGARFSEHVPSSASSMEQRSHGGAGRHSNGGPRDMSRVQCFRCDKFGHLAINCPTRKQKEQGSSGVGTGIGAGVGTGVGTGFGTGAGAASGASSSNSNSSGPKRQESASVVLASNRFDVLSSDDEEDEDVPEEKSAAPAAVVGARSLPRFGVSYAAAAAKATKVLGRAEEQQKEQVEAMLEPKLEQGLEQELEHDVPTPPRAAAMGAGQEQASDACGPLPKQSWGIDSMASLHLSGDRHQFVQLRRCSPARCPSKWRMEAWSMRAPAAPPSPDGGTSSN